MNKKNYSKHAFQKNTQKSLQHNQPLQTQKSWQPPQRAQQAQKNFVFQLPSYVYYLLPAIFIVAYAYSKNSPFETLLAALAVVSIIILLLRDLSTQELFSKQGLFSLAKELGFALAAAIALWLALSFALNSDKPLDVVTSCSMLPQIQRGDLVLIQGTEITAPYLNLSSKAKVEIDPIKSACTRKYDNGALDKGKCTTALGISGNLVSFNHSNDVIVFESSNPKYGLIIHRAFAKIEYNNTLYYLTKGDNNNVVDQETGIPAIPQKDVHGKVILRIPYLGYVKLLLFGQFKTPPGCEYVTLQG